MSEQKRTAHEAILRTLRDSALTPAIKEEYELSK